MPTLLATDVEGEDKDSGRPSIIAIVRAKEKLSNEVTEIIVDARQRLSDFRRVERGATLFVGGLTAGLRMTNRIGRADVMNTSEVRIYQGVK